MIPFPQINSKSSYALCCLVPKARRVSALSPLQLLKAVKNDTEAQGMRNSHVCDCCDIPMYDTPTCVTH